MLTEPSTETPRDLSLLETIECNPHVTQATLARQFVAKGYIDVKYAQRRRLRYILMPEGLALHIVSRSIVDESPVPTLEIRGLKIILTSAEAV
jgi:hypothetical protein